MVIETAPVKHTYTYQDILANSKKVSWSEDEVLRNRSFDLSERFLPNSLSGVDGISCLNEDEKLKLNQIMGNAYLHLFAFVEEFIVPTVTQEVVDAPYGDEVRQRSLLRFFLISSHPSRRRLISFSKPRSLGS